MKARKKICTILCALMCIPTVACGEESSITDTLEALTTTTAETTHTTTTVTTTDTQPTTAETESTPEITTEQETTEVTTTTTTTSQTTTTTTTTRVLEYTNITFSRAEIIAGASLPDTYLSYGLMDVDTLVSNYGTVSAIRDNGGYTMPEGYDLHYTTEIRVEKVPKGEYITVTGTVCMKSFESAPDGTVLSVKTEVTKPFTLMKKVV